MTALSFLPAFILMATSFTRIIVVLAITPSVVATKPAEPSSGWHRFSTHVTHYASVWSDIHQNAFLPYEAGTITLSRAFHCGKACASIYASQTQQNSLEQMMRIANEPMDTSLDDISFAVILPAFVISELKTAFQIGFMLFIPFLSSILL